MTGEDAVLQGDGGSVTAANMPLAALRGTCQCCGMAVHKSALVCTRCAVIDPEGQVWLAREASDG